MSRYIDVDALDKRRIDYIVDGYAESVADMTEWGMALIEAPTIDLVRCEECAKWRSDRFFCTQWSCGTPAVGWCYMAKQTEGSE